MSQPCPCRGCTVAYKQGKADQVDEWQSVLSSTNARAALEALKYALTNVSMCHWSHPTRESWEAAYKRGDISMPSDAVILRSDALKVIQDLIDYQVSLLGSVNE